MTADSFINEVCWRTGITSPQAAERTIQSALTAVGERLTAEDARAVAEELPPPLAGLLGSAPHRADPDVGDLYAAVQAQEGSGLGAAIEHAKVICEVLSEAVSEDTRIRLQTRLPPEWAQLFVPRQRPSVGEEDPLALQRGVPPGHGHTLADGRPGSRRPISEAVPASDLPISEAADPITRTRRGDH